MPRLCLLPFFLPGQRPPRGPLPWDLSLAQWPEGSGGWGVSGGSDALPGVLACSVGPLSPPCSSPVAWGAALKLCLPPPPKLSLHLQETKQDETSAASPPFKDGVTTERATHVLWPISSPLPVVSIPLPASHGRRRVDCSHFLGLTAAEMTGAWK